ncbi:hypothetical protein EAL2_808p00190 (plasmid) [Peptoclostridium acidaminophilum DSM 3953]|uniref:Uncharacterized protein n=1 Tax=Peptoclostridium acidaminophilum DSM 3953 TaxID=1286171 RepID=W8U9I8_PEPAC|nr:hypothetical protein EAL2_808p00190 [Peptoclostridium acidaminophilum DSM 3953]
MRLGRISFPPFAMSFNSRTRTGCDSMAGDYYYASFRSFNSRTRTGCDAEEYLEEAGENVSIHAPARGATGIRHRTHNHFYGFQFTHPHGVRLNRVVSGCLYDCVSIHAPARGATFRRQRYLRYRLVSIHAPARGATHLHNKGPSSLGFNSRTRTGCDLAVYLFLIVNVVSIHAPARGATPEPLHVPKGQLVSIHAPARGATSVASACYHVSYFVSIHAPARGATTYRVLFFGSYT